MKTGKGKVSTDRRRCILAHAKGDSLAVAGRRKLSTWTGKNGNGVHRMNETGYRRFNFHDEHVKGFDRVEFAWLLTRRPLTICLSCFSRNDEPSKKIIELFQHFGLYFECSLVCSLKHAGAFSAICSEVVFEDIQNLRIPILERHRKHGEKLRGYVFEHVHLGEQKYVVLSTHGGSFRERWQVGESAI